MRIAFVHFPGRLARLEAARSGDGPTEFLFGSVELERAGHDVTHYEVDPDAASGRVARRLVDRQAGLGRLPPHLSAAVLGGTRELLPALRDAEVVVATTTATAVSLAVWRKARRLRAPLVGIVAGLLNRPWGRTRRATTLPLLGSMHAMLYGPGEEPGLLALDPRLAGRVHVNRFGVDTRFWSPGGTATAIRPRDRQRRPPRLGARSSVRRPRSTPAIRILTRHPRPNALPDNVTWEPADWHRRLLSDADVREEFRAAAVVAVPVADVPQPSGQSVTLQASACARPVVLSRSRGLWDPEGLRDGENVLLVPPGDVDALATALQRVLADPVLGEAIGRAARASVEATGGVEAYAGRLLDVCLAAVERP